jgi:hypothetical protein
MAARGKHADVGQRAAELMRTPGRRPSEALRLAREAVTQAELLRELEEISVKVHEWCERIKGTTATAEARPKPKGVA